MADRGIRATDSMVPRMSPALRSEFCRIISDQLTATDRDIHRNTNSRNYGRVKDLGNEAEFLKRMGSHCAPKRYRY